MVLVKLLCFGFLIGIEEPTSGRIQKARGVTFGYLPQEALLSDTCSLWDECLKALSELVALEAELSRLEGEMGDQASAEIALERYAKLQPDFERRGGYIYETRIRQTLYRAWL